MPKPLSVEDFDFSGPLGSQGARIEERGENHFHITLSHAPNNPHWPNMANFTITGNAKGNPLRIDATAGDHASPKPGWSFNNHPYAWSADCETWHVVEWQQGSRETLAHDTLIFPPFPADTIYAGLQTPLTYEHSVKLINEWCTSPYASQHLITHSHEGRPIVRLDITDPHSPHSPDKRWGHYFTHQHPGEHHAQWRMIGMVRWLLSDDPEAQDFRQRSICRFLLWMSPDGPSHGWYRVNAEGVDMNRSYRAQGSDQQEQTHEAYHCQKDLENLMASTTPIDTIWAMHTWRGLVEPMIYGCGPEFGTSVGEWTQLKNTLAELDVDQLIKPLALRDPERRPQATWTRGPLTQFGITSILCEGANTFNQQQNLTSGQTLIHALARFYKGVRAPHRP